MKSMIEGQMEKTEKLEKMLAKHCKVNKKKVLVVQEKYRNNFDKQAVYMGNGIYSVSGLASNDTRELFLLFVLQQEGIDAREV